MIQSRWTTTKPVKMRFLWSGELEQSPFHFEIQNTDSTNIGVKVMIIMPSVTVSKLVIPVLF